MPLTGKSEPADPTYAAQQRMDRLDACFRDLLIELQRLPPGPIARQVQTDCQDFRRYLLGIVGSL